MLPLLIHHYHYTQAMEARELKIKLKLSEERLDAKTQELITVKSFLATVQAEHDGEKTKMSNKIDELHKKLNDATVEAANLKGQLMGSETVTTLTKEHAKSAMSILYDQLRTTPGVPSVTERTPSAT